MPEIKFSDAGIRRLSTSKKRAEFFDSRYPNLVLRITHRGTKTFLFRQKRTESGRRPGKNLGRYPDLSLKNAIRLYREESQREAAGEPPPELHDRIKDLEAELAKLKRQAGDAYTFDNLADEFIERYSKTRKKTWKNDLYSLRRDPLRVWKGKAVEEIRKVDVNRLLDEVAERAPVQANRLLSLLHRMWTWGMSKDLVEFNPCSGIEKPTEEKPRNRALRDRELALVWSMLSGEEGNGLPSVSVAPVLREGLKLLIVTAQRRSEVSGMLWKEIETPWWDLDPDRTKPERHHRVFLSPLAQEIVERQRAVTDPHSPHVFQSDRMPEKAIHEHSLTHAMERISDALLEAKLFTEGATVHDLRRTATTGMSKLGVLRHVLKRVLNHSDSSVTARYDLYRYDKEVRDALHRWSDHLEEVLRRPPGAC